MPKKNETSCPPIVLNRNEYGLFDHINYEFNEDGSINYKKLISSEFLVPNKQFFERRKQEVPKSIDGLSDKEVLVLLMGWRNLAFLRGFNSIEHEIIDCSLQYVSVKTTVKWIGNYETQGREVSYDGFATASLSNTFNIAQKYLGEIAANRAESRAIRGFLRIPILSFDEVGPEDSDKFEGSKESPESSSSNPAGPQAALERALNKKGKSFESLKSRLIKDTQFIESCGSTIEQIQDWSNESSVPNGVAVKILGWINKN